jgi:hypothetical protein
MRQGNWRSRKLWAAASALVVEVVLAFGVDADVAKVLGSAVAVIVSAYVVGQGYADGQASRS